ncbi:MAG TPA: hypothetical protein VIZ61_14920 [Solirubrobacterales bacterium]
MALEAVMLAGVLLLSIGSLTAGPAFSGNETWSTSSIWSLLHGHGYEPWPNVGSGAYDGIPDYWSTRLGLLPSLLGELVFPTTLALNRAHAIYRSTRQIASALRQPFLQLGRRHGAGG